MNITDLYSWLSSFINMERGLGGGPSSAAEEHFKLDRMMILSELAGHPELSVPVIHVAGSKGKGSVTAMTAAILEQAGIKTARYMSPHVSDWRERISRGDGSFFPDTVYEKAGEELQEVYKAYTKLNEWSGEPTYFELMTLLFFLCARLENCKAMVVETGLGGRLDATNIVDSVVSVITVIEKEHTEYLGNTLAEIAYEKAGIIKKGHPVVSAEQKPEVLAVLQQKARELNAPFVYVTDSVTIPDMQLKGKIYAYNAALAVQAVRLAFPGIDESCIEKGLLSVTLPAHFEKVIIDPPFIIDGAHTPLSINHCIETFCELYGNVGILLFGCAADKEAGLMAELLLPHFSYCIVTATGGFRASDPAAVYEAFCSVGNNISLSCISDTATAIDEVIKLSKEKELPVLACGSFYLAAEIRKILC
ncbi:MAG: bifunctional folylpolyglutamate synthase/dihydrofolate synthase [Treponema sp.]|nr:bifunctional folylpolyglutamate synthase/dihydrofolate synthase [Treponema sp.]